MTEKRLSRFQAFDRIHQAIEGVMREVPGATTSEKGKEPQLANWFDGSLSALGNPSQVLLTRNSSQGRIIKHSFMVATLLKGTGDDLIDRTVRVERWNMRLPLLGIVSIGEIHAYGYGGRGYYGEDMSPEQLLKLGNTIVDAARSLIPQKH